MKPTTQTITQVTKTAENLRDIILQKQSSSEEGSLILVEQEPFLQDMYINILKPLGLKYKCVSNGNYVYAQLIKTKCKIMIIDVMLPSIDGLEIIKTVRETFNLDFPIIVLTNFVSEKIVEAAYLVGADDYLVKTDIKPEELIYSVRTQLKKSSRKLTINALNS